MPFIESEGRTHIHNQTQAPIPPLYTSKCPHLDQDPFPYEWNFRHESTSSIAAGRSCYTPNGQIGVCQVFQYCASLIQLYQYNRNQETVNFLLASQRSCGNRNFNGSPVLCCSDGVQYDPTTTSSPFVEVTTAPPTTLAPLRTADCIGPDNREGYCISEYAKACRISRRRRHLSSIKL